jgi:pyruvate ferredoxin oxidoreductase delta subunit
MVGFKLSHCKGCGICAKMCPKDAIVMSSEE